MPAREFTVFTHAAVNSMLNQSHDQLELLLLCQGDTETFSNQLPQDDRLRIIPREAPGIIGALNTGLAYCNGEYIARMDSDDLSHVDRLKVQLAFAQKHPEIGLIGAQVELFSDSHPIGAGNQAYQQWLNGLTTAEQIRAACFIESPMPHPTWFAHKKIWQQLSAYRDKAWPEDYDLILRSWLLGIAMAKPAGTLLHWREHPHRLTHTDDRYSRLAFIRAKAWALCQPAAKLNLEQGRPVWICGTGRNARYWHDALVDNGVTVLGFVELDSARAKTQKRHLPVINYNDLEQLKSDSLVISAISNANAREALRLWFNDRHMRQLHDFILGG